MGKTQVKTSVSCSKCASLSINLGTDEAYCALEEEREIFLRKGQKCPRWCPLKKKEENVND